jgi:hypothetical protein
MITMYRNKKRIPSFAHSAKEGIPNRVISAASPLRRWASSGYASGVKHPRNACIHLFLFDKFSPVGLRDAFAHSGAKTGVLFKQTHNSILYQSLGIRTGVTGDLR